jgi:predicted nucleic acid-binding protein
MSGKTFLDTNIVVYLFSGDEPEKRAAAHAFIEGTLKIHCPFIKA